MKYSIISLTRHFRGLFFGCALVALASCAKDETFLENSAEISSEESTQGTFIVNYAMNDETSAAARSAHSNQTIRSLHYLVYNEKDKRLIKIRRIRGIDENTVWPITDRDNMTWELRQDLQDTLFCNINYHILFIANAAPELFEKISKKDESGQEVMVDQKILADENLYDQVKLFLPKEPFRADNMFYMWDGEIRTQTSAPPMVKRENVLLRRVVAQTEFMRQPGAETDAHLYDAIDRGFYSSYAGSIQDQCLEQFTTVYVNDLNQKIIDANSSKWPYTGNTTDKLGPNGEGAAARLRDFLNQKESQDLIYEAAKQKVINSYLNEIKLISDYQKQSGIWTSTNGSARSVKLIYEAQNEKANCLFLHNRQISRKSQYETSEIVENHIYPIDEQGHFFVTGFTTNDASTTLNTINSLSFYDSAQGAEEVAFVKNVPFTIRQGLNTWKKIICDPVFKIIYKSKNMKDTNVTINLNEVFKGRIVYTSANESMTWEELMAVKGNNRWKTLLEYLDNYSYSSVSKYKISINNIPETQNDRIEIRPEWTVQ